MTPTIKFTLRQLHYFVTAAQAGQISIAATQAHISQSAMTTAIGELERLLGAALFERSKTGITLTYEGHAFLQQAQAVLDTANEASRFPFHRSTDVVGRLEIAASYTVLGYFLLPAIARFRQLFPLVDLVPVELTRPEIEAQLGDGRIEIAVALLSNMDHLDELHTHVLTRSRRQLWVGAHHPLAGRGTASLAEVAGYPYVLPTMDDAERNALQFWDSAGLRPASLLRTSSMEALREMVGLGLGLTILSDMVFRPWSLEGRRIHALPVDARVPVMEVGLAWHPQRPLSPAAQAFKEFLVVSSSSLSGVS
jgi:DNA-binding transcriptional LysR family regulator